MGDSYYGNDQPLSSAFSIASSEEERHHHHSKLFKRIFSVGSKGRLDHEYHKGSHSPDTTTFARSKKLPGPTFIMTPSPNTRPLLSKPSARDEIQPRRMKSFGERPSTGFAHARQEAQRVLESREKEASRSRAGTTTTCSSRHHAPISIEVPQDLYTRNLRDRERIAVDAALNGQYVREWGFFIKCYAEGRFNLSNPPDPPPRRPDFIHFTAPAPPNERQRLKAAQTCNISLSPSSRQKCQKLVQLACTVFQTPMASISIIDEHHEVVKSECGLGCKYIDRPASIAAHVLLANEPMIVSDTSQDWRFAGNPLVTTDPYIQFYAGAPIVTYEGHTIGVFAVFDTQPRASFPTASRRKLMDFSRLVMSEIEAAMEQQELPTVPKPSTEKVLNRVNAVDDFSDTESEVSHRGKLTEKILKGIEDDAKMMDEPYPAGEASEVFPHFPTHPAARPIPRRKHIPIQIPEYYQSLHDDEDTLETPPLTPCRPFSVSSFTSGSSDAASTLEFTPTRTPRNSFISVAPSSSAENVIGACASDFIRPPQKSIITEAEFATSLIARSLSYDLVYLLRVTVAPSQPDSPFLPFDPMKPLTDVSTKVLVSHGLPNPAPIFDAALHLRATRSLGGLIYQNPVRDRGSADDTVGYQVGILLPLAKYERGGVVLAAFSVHQEERFSSEEVKFLKEFGEAMKDILMKADPEPGCDPSMPW